MPETSDIDPQRVNRHLTTKIVRSYVQHHTVGTVQVSELITSVHGALAQLGRPNQPEEVLTPAVPVRRSVRQDYVICLDCGIGEDAATPHQYEAWVEPIRLSEALGVAQGPSSNRPRLFRATR